MRHAQLLASIDLAPLSPLSRDGVRASIPDSAGQLACTAALSVDAHDVAAPVTSLSAYGHRAGGPARGGHL